MTSVITKHKQNLILTKCKSDRMLFHVRD